jgi:L-threonylcarbamoyladenylate synthase
VPRVISVDRDKPDHAAIVEAAGVLARGGLVAFPTETVYGLGARGLHAEEVARIFAAKGRPPTHPIILHVDGEPMARALASEWPDAAARLSAAWPGPLTLVVPRTAAVPNEVTAGLVTVGVRAPAHPVALALIREVGEPLAAPSANAHTHVSPTTAVHVIRSLGDTVDLVLDAGPCTHGIESTVVTVAEDPPRVLRPGALGLDRLRALVPSIVHAPKAAVLADDVARASPGLAAKHYSPRAKVELAERGASSVTAALECARSGARVGALVFSGDAHDAMGRSAKDRASAPDLVRFVSMPDDPEAYGQKLYAAFYELDAAKVDVIVVERPPPNERWWAITDRLDRAAR